jgi:hypothetical protein
MFFAALHGVRARVVRASRNGGLRFFFGHFSKLLIPHSRKAAHAGLCGGDGALVDRSPT